MALVTIRDLTIHFRGPALLDGVTCQIEPGQRIGLLGRNGSGKTTFLRLLSGEAEADSGVILLTPQTKVSLLPQDVPREIVGSVADVVARGLPADEQAEHWNAQQSVQQILSRMDLDAEARFETLSSGMKRRVLLARALVGAPDLLLLDEPTNHLDIDAISWLEDFLLSRWNGTLIFVTHDRMFLRKLATRILEIDRGRLFDWSCDYDTFVQRKEAALEAEEKQQALFDKKLAEEEVWIRQGIKARRTRNEGRVRALEEMRRQRSERQSSGGLVQMQIQEGQRSGNLVAEVKNVTFAYPETSTEHADSVLDGSGVPYQTGGWSGDQPRTVDTEHAIVNDFSTTIMRGDKIGIIGPNGAGKTTLLRLLLGKLPPQQGTVRIGTNVQIAYFDQLRQQLDDEKTVQENVGDGYDTVQVGGQARHVIGYLRDFLFSPDRARTPVRFLSGGERNRVLLARLFAKPANVIVLDEPTNDLDTETLELLEERLVQFTGTVLLVSHDRAFLNNVATSTIVFEERGVQEYVGGYDDWLRQRPQPLADSADTRRQKAQSLEKTSASAGSTVDSNAKRAEVKRRLSYKEQQELAALPTTIEQLEADIATLHRDMSQPTFYQQPREQIAQEQRRLKEFDQRLATAYQRWEELEQLAD